MYSQYTAHISSNGSHFLWLGSQCCEKKRFKNKPHQSWGMMLHHSPLILLRLRNRITVHAQTAARQQSNGKSEARMSGKCEDWRDQFMMTLSPIPWVPVQDKGSKILHVKFGAMKIIPSDRLHQKYLTINLGNTSD